MSAIHASPAASPPKFSRYSQRLLFGFSPWLFVGLSSILALVIILLALWNMERERERVTQNFLDRANALIWALEAGARTEMGFGESSRLLQPFVVETARQRGISYIAVIDMEGRILAHSDPRQVGDSLSAENLPSAAPAKDIAWRIPRDAGVFEAYREFSPVPGYHHNPFGHRMRRRHGEGGRMAGGPARQRIPPSFAVIGFDRTPYEALLSQYRFNNAVTAFVAALLGLGSFFSLFWAHGYRRSRRLLKDTRALASEVVTSLPMGLITCEPDGALGMVNETALAMLRMDREKAAGASLRAIPALDWAELINALDRNTKVIEHEMELAAGGESRPVSVSASRIRDEDGLFLGHLFILRDISDVKRLQAEARRNDRLAALGSLAAGVAHEIRNPLSSIKGLATFLAERSRSSEAEEEAAKTMIGEVDRLNRVVSQLLDFARPGAVRIADTDVNAVIAHTLRLADADIRAKQIRVVRAGDDFPLLAPLHGERFTQALLNLFLNAIQAMEPGGTLTVSAGPRDGGSVCGVSVQDDGKGMSQETLASIFTPYFTTKASGAGLGLAIVHQIIERHGGAVSVKSAPGAGSMFTLLVPMRGSPKEKA